MCLRERTRVCNTAFSLHTQWSILFLVFNQHYSLIPSVPVLNPSGLFSGTPLHLKKKKKLQKWAKPWQLHSPIPRFTCVPVHLIPYILNGISPIFSRVWLHKLHLYFKYFLIKINLVGWRGDSLIKRAWDWFSVPTSWLKTIHNTGSRESNTLFWFPQVLDMHTAHIHTCRQNSHTQKIKEITLLKKWKDTCPQETLLSNLFT